MDKVLDTDLGLFGPKSMVWKLHSSKFALIGGVRALMVQALDPRAMAAVEMSGGYKVDPLGRLNRTIAYVQSVSFGTTTEAERAVAAVRRIHESVRGVDPLTGLFFDATDPSQLAFVHNTLVESIATAHKVFDCSVSGVDLDRYVSEMRVLGRAFGVSEPQLPDDYEAICGWVADYEGLVGTQVARRAVRYLQSPSMGFPFSELWRIAYVGAVFSLTGEQREMLGLSQAPLERFAARPIVTGVLGIAGLLLPSSPAVVEARNRAHQAWQMERGLISGP